MPQVKIHAEKYEQLIDRRGRPIMWEEAVMCTCWDFRSGQPLYSCRACNGKGYIYMEPVESNALVMSVNLSKDFQDMAGVFEVGDAVMTVPKHIPKKLYNGGYDMSDIEDNPMYDIGLWDRVTLLDDEYKSSEILIKGIPMDSRPADTLRNDKITGVKSIQKYNKNTGEATYYELGIDFAVQGSKINWIDMANSPSEGEQYSVVYFHRPIYIVTATLPKPRHQDGQDLPRYVALRYLDEGVAKK
jgi:hypothetical protein